MVGLYAQGDAAAVEAHAARPRRDVVEPDHRAARPLPGRGVERRSGPRSGSPTPGGRRAASRAAGRCSSQYVSPPLAADKGRRDRARLAHRDRRGGPRRRRPRAPTTRPRAPEAGRELPGREPRAPSRAATWTSCGPRPRSRSRYVKRFYFARGGPRLLADLRGPRRRLPARLALGRLHRLDAPLRATPRTASE